MSITLQPLPESRRDISLDVLRGFALAGVLFMFCVNDIGAPKGYANSVLDEIVAWPKWILVESRMYTMLILVFGIGFHVQLEKARMQQASLVPVFSRRLIGLLFLGFIHAIFLSTRDILMFYAIAGTALLFVRNLSNRQLLIFISIVFLLLVTPVIPIFFDSPWQKANALVQPNNYKEHLQYNWQFFKLYHQIYLIYIDMLFHFLLGFWISKAGLLQKLKTSRKLRRKLLLITLVVALLLGPVNYYWFSQVFPGLVAKMPYYWQKFLAYTFARTVWQSWMLVSVTLYACILISLSVSTKANRLKPLAAFGQMALSNYLMQSLILVPSLLLLDRFNNIPPFTGLLIYLPVFAFQLVFSSWW
ncbi:MAG TPA: DUF418 domain-containing protein, partial [Chitinophagaceae bacterium]|nr:DUF418 domain-containing protein [Chitinophagaceae bacterium]